MIDLMLNWSEWVKPSAGLPTVQWSLLLALAAAVGHVLQRYLGLPKVLGYSAVGALAGLSGYTTTTWPLGGIGQFMVELALSIVLFEAGGRLTLRWFRHNPMLLLQSLAEAGATYGAVWWVLQLCEVDDTLRMPMALLLVATSPAVVMRVASDLRASGPVTDRAITLAALNTLYVLALGGVMAWLMGRPPALLADALYPVILLLAASVLMGALLAYALRKALLLMSPTSENTAVLQLALIAASTTLTANFGGSAPLAALLAGILLKTSHPRPWSWPRQFGTAATGLTILMFVLVSMAAAQAPWDPQDWSLIAGLILARALAKLAAVGVTGIGSGASPKQAVWTAGAMWPMSAVPLLLVSQFVTFSPAIGNQVAALALPLLLVMEILGALMSVLVLQRAGEAGRPLGMRRPRNEREYSDAA